MFGTRRPQKVIDGVATAFSRLLGAALIIAVIVNVVNVVARYGFNHAFTGADELQIYLMIGMAFPGGLVAHIRRRHLRMDLLVEAIDKVADGHERGNRGLDRCNEDRVLP